jgi:SAM-dependent methyltransferase
VTDHSRHHDGYVVDVPYIEPIAPDLSPGWFSAMAVLHGQPPLDRTCTLRWMELGSGAGLSACMVAAANDGVEVWGCDVNPAHVERSASFARKVGLTNCQFVEASFAAVAADRTLGPPEVDVIVVHGVFSWVSPANQRHIADIVRQRLRPGGLLYVGYELGTGWSSMVPVAEALRLYAEADARRSDLVFHDAAAAMTELAELGARCFPLGPVETRQFEGMAEANASYAAHEYLGGHFRPVMFDEIAALFAATGCSLVGGIGATQPLHAYWVPPDLTDLVRNTADLVLREMLRDLATMRALRTDLFRRGLAFSTPPAHTEREDQLRLVGLGRELPDPATVAVPVGDLTIDRDAYLPLVEALEHGPLTLPDVISIHPEWSRSDSIGALCVLMGAGIAAPATGGESSPSVRERVRAMNRALIEENRLGADHRVLIAPATGAAIESEWVEMVALGALWDGVAAEVTLLADHVTAVLSRLDWRVREDDALVDDTNRARQIVEQRVARMLRRVDGVFQRLGIC